MIKNFTLSLRLSHIRLSAEEIISMASLEIVPSTTISVGKSRLLKDGSETKPPPRSIVRYQLTEQFLERSDQGKINDEILQQVEKLKKHQNFFNKFYAIDGISSLGLAVFSQNLYGNLSLNRYAISVLSQLHINSQIYFYSLES